MVTHFREYWLFGLFFAVVTPLQIAWAGFVWRAPDDRRLLKLGALGNGSIAFVWLVSRTVGVPFGPERLNAEAVGVTDVLATVDELMIVGLLSVLLLGAGCRNPPAWTLTIAWVLAGAGLVTALVGGGH